MMDMERVAVSLYDQELNLIEEDIKFDVLPRVDDFLFIDDDAKYKVVSVVHRIKRLPRISDTQSVDYYSKINMIVVSV